MAMAQAWFEPVGIEDGACVSCCACMRACVWDEWLCVRGGWWLWIRDRSKVVSQQLSVNWKSHAKTLSNDFPEPAFQVRCEPADRSAMVVVVWKMGSEREKGRRNLRIEEMPSEGVQICDPAKEGVGVVGPDQRNGRRGR